MTRTVGIVSLSSGVIGDTSLSVVANINVGHATPRCIVPLRRDAVVDTQKQEILFTE